MSETPKTFAEELMSDLKQQRDQLRVRIHLGSLDLKDEFGKLDDQLAELNQRLGPLKNATGESAENIWESIQLLGSEISDGFQRIRKSLS